MIALVLFLVIIGVGLYLLNTLPIAAPIKTLIHVIVVICVVVYLLRLFGVVDIPVPRLR